MTDQHGRVLVWDTSPLHHAIKADKIDILGDLAGTSRGCPRRNVTTQAVMDELRRHQLPAAGLGWLEVVHVDGLDELTALLAWVERVSAQQANQGEATVLAWAQVHGAIPVVDDRDARRAARGAGLEVWGSLRVIAESVSEGRLTEYAATAFVDSLADTGARYPCGRGEFITWAHRHGLL